MNFAGWPFLGLFLPVVLVVHYAIRGSRAAQWRQAWLITASTVFYGVSGLSNLAVLLCSVAVNFAAGKMLADGVPNRRARLAMLWIAVAFNVGMLATFKLDSLWERQHGGFLTSPIVLIPLALSFITFQQIGFVVACYRRQVKPVLFDYLFFVIFFPQLIMGPILQYQAIEPQLRGGALERNRLDDFAVGLAIFIFGLAQKLLLADLLGAKVEPIYDALALGLTPSAAEAWWVLLAFPLQLFLDFSAYADMAIGLGRMVGIALPINFDEPLKAVNRFDVWRRWHITFVTFMRSNVFMPLVRNLRLAPIVALFTTAFLAGLWHGLGWTFLLWSFLQASLMLLVHLRPRRHNSERGRIAMVWAIGWTFFLTCLLSAIFRAPSLEGVGLLLSGLAGLSGVADGYLVTHDYVVLAAATAFVFLFPDAKRFFARHWSALEPRGDAPRPAPAFPLTGGLRFELNAFWGSVMAVALVAALSRAGWAERFIYVQF